MRQYSALVLLFTFALIDLVRLSVIIDSKTHHVIYLNEKSQQSVRLKSVLNVFSKNLTSTSKSQKLFWSFKRIYSMPNFQGNFLNLNSFYVKTTNELSQNELMISLDSEVLENLQNKYSIGVGEKSNQKLDLIINNLTYADSGLYKCQLWNQKTIYYHLIVTSKNFDLSFFLLKS
jgi:hypothetical protein